MFDFINNLRVERFNYWLALIGVVLSFAGLFAMQLRLQQIPRRARLLDPPYLAAFVIFLIGAATCLDFILELFGIYTLSGIRTTMESLLGINFQ